jgi:hypothetical protein
VSDINSNPLHFDIEGFYGDRGIPAAPNLDHCGNYQVCDLFTSILIVTHVRISNPEISACRFEAFMAHELLAVSASHKASMLVLSQRCARNE